MVHRRREFDLRAMADIAGTRAQRDARAQDLQLRERGGLPARGNIGGVILLRLEPNRVVALLVAQDLGEIPAEPPAAIAGERFERPGRGTCRTGCRRQRIQRVHHCRGGMGRVGDIRHIGARRRTGQAWILTEEHHHLAAGEVAQAVESVDQRQPRSAARGGGASAAAEVTNAVDGVEQDPLVAGQLLEHTGTFAAAQDGHAVARRNRVGQEYLQRAANGVDTRGR